MSVKVFQGQCLTKKCQKPYRKCHQSEVCAFYAISEITNILKNLDFQSFFDRREAGNLKILFF